MFDIPKTKEDWRKNTWPRRNDLGPLIAHWGSEGYLVSEIQGFLAQFRANGGLHVPDFTDSEVLEKVFNEKVLT